jgi:hypothetical protein
MADSMALSRVSSQSLGRTERKPLMVRLERRVASKSPVEASDSTVSSLFSIVAVEGSDSSASCSDVVLALYGLVVLVNPAAYLEPANTSMNANGSPLKNLEMNIIPSYECVNK